MDENIKWFSKELFEQFLPDDKKMVIGNILSAFNEHRKSSVGESYLKYSCIFDNVQMFQEHKGSENFFTLMESFDEYVEPTNRQDICKIEDIQLYGIVEENKKIVSVAFKLADDKIILLTDKGVTP